MTKAEMNIIIRVVEAQIRVYQQQMKMNKADEDENEAAFEKHLSLKKSMQNRAADYKKSFFDGFITGKDISDNYDAINKELLELCSWTGYPLDNKEDAVWEFFGDMIRDAKARGELE